MQVSRQEIREPRPRAQEGVWSMEISEMIRQREIQLAEEQRQLEAEAEFDMI